MFRCTYTTTTVLNSNGCVSLHCTHTPVLNSYRCCRNGTILTQMFSLYRAPLFCTLTDVSPHSTLYFGHTDVIKAVLYASGSVSIYCTLTPVLIQMCFTLFIQMFHYGIHSLLYCTVTDVFHTCTLTLHRVLCVPYDEY